MPTALGWPLIAMPTIPAAPQTVEFTIINAVAMSVSPFTFAAQIQDWGAGVIEANISMPPLQQIPAQNWIAFAMALRGPVGVFQFGDPLALAPRLGVGTGSMTVSGAGQTGFALTVTGWTGTLSPGDWIQIGYRLYRNLTTAVLTGGAGTLSIYPQLRESPGNGDAVILSNTRGLFRMKSNTQKWSETQARYYGLQFECREAL